MKINILIFSLVLITNNIQALTMVPFVDGTPKLDKDKWTICGATMNSIEEFDAFRTILPEDQFQFVELTDFASNKDYNPSQNWFRNACQSKIQCHMLVVSGHFTASGRQFYGFDSKYRLDLDTINQHSCSASCSGILNNPAQTFLMGCNTLNSKTKEGSRTNREQRQFVRQIQRASGLSRSQAQEVATSFNASSSQYVADIMKESLAGVKRIEGFDGTAPKGNKAGPAMLNVLKGYQHKYGSISKYLQHLYGMIEDEEEIIKKAEKGESLLEQIPDDGIMHRYFPENHVTCKGAQSDVVLDPFDPAMEMKQTICKIIGTDTPFSEKLKVLTELIERGQLGIYISAIGTFFANDWDILSDEERQKLMGLFEDENQIKSIIFDYINLLDLGSSLDKILRLAGLMDLISHEEKGSILSNKLKKMLFTTQNVTQDIKDLVCSYATKGAFNSVKFEYNEIAGSFFKTPIGLTTIACLGNFDRKTFRKVERIYKKDKKGLGSDAFKFLLKNAPSTEYFKKLLKTKANSEIELADKELLRFIATTPGVVPKRKKIIEYFISRPSIEVSDVAIAISNLELSPLDIQETTAIIDDLPENIQTKIFATIFMAVRSKGNPWSITPKQRDIDFANDYLASFFSKRGSSAYHAKSYASYFLNGNHPEPFGDITSNEEIALKKANQILLSTLAKTKFFICNRNAFYSHRNEDLNKYSLLINDISQAFLILNGALNLPFEEHAQEIDSIMTCITQSASSVTSKQAKLFNKVLVESLQFYTRVKKPKSLPGLINKIALIKTQNENLPKEFSFFDAEVKSLFLELLLDQNKPNYVAHKYQDLTRDLILDYRLSGAHLCHLSKSQARANLPQGYILDIIKTIIDEGDSKLHNSQECILEVIFSMKEVEGEQKIVLLEKMHNMLGTENENGSLSSYLNIFLLSPHSFSFELKGNQQLLDLIFSMKNFDSEGMARRMIENTNNYVYFKMDEADKLVLVNTALKYLDYLYHSELGKYLLSMKNNGFAEYSEIERLNKTLSSIYLNIEEPAFILKAGVLHALTEFSTNSNSAHSPISKKPVINSLLEAKTTKGIFPATWIKGYLAFYNDIETLKKDKFTQDFHQIMTSAMKSEMQSIEQERLFSYLIDYAINSREGLAAISQFQRERIGRFLLSNDKLYKDERFVSEKTQPIVKAFPGLLSVFEKKVERIRKNGQISRERFDLLKTYITKKP